MTYLANPKSPHPGLPKNSLGYTHRDYEGKISTLCAGCGHDSITASIIEACYELSIEPHSVAKISGSDCAAKTKRCGTNTANAVDLVAIALQLGPSFVARSFSGDKTQLVPLIAAAIEHKGAAFIDVISPCIAFNNHAGSTKSFDYVREHNDAVNRLDVI